MKKVFLFLALSCIVLSCSNLDKASKQRQKEFRKRNFGKVLYTATAHTGVAPAENPHLLIVGSNGLFEFYLNTRVTDTRLTTTFHAGEYEMRGDTLRLNYVGNVVPWNFKPYMIFDDEKKFLVQQFTDDQPQIKLKITYTASKP